MQIRTTFVVGVFAFALSLSANAVTYRIADIGLMPAVTAGGHGANISGINNLGEVVGRTVLGGGAPLSGFKWSESNGFVDLGQVTPWDINNEGVVAGNTAYGQAMQWRSEPGISIVGGMVTAWGINSAGDMAGAWQAYGSDPAQAIYRSSHGEITNLSQRYGQAGFAFDLNDAGFVVGSLGTNAYIWDASGGLTYLAPTATDSMSWAINNSGQVVGALVGAGAVGRYHHSFLWENGVLSILDSSSAFASMAFSINERGQVVGSQGDHAYLWESDSGMIDLNSILDAGSNWRLLEANGINDSGQIAGIGLIDGQRHGFLLTPIPEPGTYALMLSGLGMLGLARRRKAEACNYPIKSHR